MKYKSAAASRNVPELMDDYFRLYAPAFMELLQEDPKATGVSGFIGRDDPSALLTSETSRGYASRAFEDKSRRLLTPLVDATMALQNSCSITRGRDEPVSVSAKRVGSEVAIQVTVSDKLGGIHARRMGQCAPAEIDAFFLYPPELVLTVGSEDGSVLEALQAAAATGFGNAVRAASEHGAILNRKWVKDNDEASLDSWLREFPRQDDDPAAFADFMAHYRRITAESSHKPMLIMAPSSNYIAVAAKFDRNVVEPLELDAESLQYRP
jgi:hypothetical protein